MRYFSVKQSKQFLELLEYGLALSTILAIIFWDILMFGKIFVSPQVKRFVIISNKHGIYELPHELPNALHETRSELKSAWDFTSG